MLLNTPPQFDDDIYQAHRNLLCAIYNRAILDLEHKPKKREVGTLYYDALFFLRSDRAKGICTWIDCLNDTILDRIVDDIEFRQLVIRRLKRAI